MQRQFYTSNYISDNEYKTSTHTYRSIIADGNNEKEIQI